MIIKKLTKKEIEIWKEWQFFDKHGFFPFEKKKITLTLVGTAIEIIEDKENKSQFIENLILNK